MKKTRKTKTIPDEDDWEALDRFARNIAPEMLTPLSEREKLLWEAFKRNRVQKKKGRGKHTGKL